MPKPCIVCNNNSNQVAYVFKERQLGLLHNANYSFCPNCGTMQVEEIPTDLSVYYPNDDYYSFNLQLNIKSKPNTLRKIKTDYILFKKQPILGRLLTLGYNINELYYWVKYTKAQYNSSILDVGTGNGALLARLHEIGFTNLTGIDPFINETKDYGTIKIVKQDLFDVTTTYDVVMMHHALEHTLDPLKALQQVYKILKPGGRALIRVPIMGNYGWKTYGEFWAGLDAPRHIFIPSEKALHTLVQQAGFTVEKFYYDSYDYIVWCSEQYKAGIPLHAKNSYLMDKKASLFTKKQILDFRKTIIAENKKGNGDMAAMYLVKPLH